MRFEVPQFIDIEDKLFGPLTFKQFLYLAGGGGLSLVLYLSLPLFLAAILIAPIAILSLALAFYKYNNRPFIVFLEDMFNFYIAGKLYTWQKREKPVEQAVEEIIDPQGASIAVPRLSDSKLKDLAWSLDIEERRRSGEVL